MISIIRVSGWAQFVSVCHVNLDKWVCVGGNGGWCSKIQPSLPYKVTTGQQRTQYKTVPDCHHRLRTHNNGCHPENGRQHTSLADMETAIVVVLTHMTLTLVT